MFFIKNKKITSPIMFNYSINNLNFSIKRESPFINFQTFADVVREDIITSVNPSSITRRPSSIYTIDGRYVGTDKNALGHGLYIVDGKKFIK